MRLSSHVGDKKGGFSLTEVMVSLGVLAIAIPFAYAAMIQAADADAAARVESLSPAITRACLNEWRGRARTEDRSSEAPVSAKEFIVRGFSTAGEPLAEIDPDAYRLGCAQSGVAYLARMEAVSPETTADAARKFRILIEYPAAARQERRQRLEFLSASPS